MWFWTQFRIDRNIYKFKLIIINFTKYLFCHFKFKNSHAKYLDDNNLAILSIFLIFSQILKLMKMSTKIKVINMKKFKNIYLYYEIHPILHHLDFLLIHHYFLIIVVKLNHQIHNIVINEKKNQVNLIYQSLSNN